MQQSLAVGWFPEDEWALALERWPALADELPRDHVAYRAAVEARLRGVSAGTRGAVLLMVPLTVAALDAEAGAEGEGADAGSTELRGRTASLLAGQGHGTPWPPGRNEPCWCHSGRKYKQCCRALDAPPATTPG